MNRKGLILFAIILIGITVRIIGINFGLPLLCHNDEPVIVNYALAYGGGDFNPHFFKVPPLLSYLLFVLYGIFFVLGRIVGYFQSINDFGYRFLSDPTLFYLIGRVFIGFIFGAAAIPMIYVFGKKVFDQKTGLFAALFLALNFMHVRNSHYIYFDVPLVFFTILFFVTLYSVFIKNTVRSYLISGIVLGAAISVKYSAIILFFPAVLISAINFVRFRDSLSNILKKSSSAIIMILLALFATNPFMFLDYHFFIDTMSRMPFFKPPFWFHIKVSLFGGIGLLLCISALIGMLRSLVKKNIFAFILILFTLSYLYILSISSQLAERYVFPVLPVLLLFAAYFVSSLMAIIKGQKLRYFCGTLICTVLLYPSLVKIYYTDKLFMARDTRQQFYDWVMENIPNKTRIAVDATGSIVSILPQNRESIEESLLKLDNPKFGTPDKALNKKVQLILKNPYYPDKFYNIYFIKTRPGKDRFLKTYPEVYLDIDNLRDLSVEYIVLNTLLLHDRNDLPFLRDVEEHTILVKDISPYKDGIDRIQPEEKTVVPAAAFSLSELTDRDSFGPVIRIYKIKDKKE